MSAWNEHTRQTNHSALQSIANKASWQTCIEVIKQCKEALRAMPDNPKAGHYQDEIHYYSMRLQSLRNK